MREEIPTSADDNGLIFEHWIEDEWIQMETYRIPGQLRGSPVPFCWMAGLSGEIEILYGLPNFRGGYRLPTDAGRLLYQGIEKAEQGRWNLFHRESGSGIDPCVRVWPTIIPDPAPGTP